MSDEAKFVQGSIRQLTTGGAKEFKVGERTFVAAGPTVAMREADVEAVNAELERLRARVAEVERERDYWKRKTGEAREALAPSERREEQLRGVVESLIELHSPRTPAQRRRYAEDERGWNLMLGGLVTRALELCPRAVQLCEPCDGLGLVRCQCGDPSHCGDGETVCAGCDGEGEVPP